MAAFMPYVTVVDRNGPSRLYEILPFLVDKPLQAIIAETYDDPAVPFRSAQRASMSFYRSLPVCVCVCVCV